MVENSANPVVPAASTASWFDSIKESAVNMWHKIIDSKSIIFDLILFFGVGFLIGFFLRKYGQYVAALIVFLVCLVVLAQLNIVDIGINWSKVEQLLGMKQPVAAQGHALFTMYWDWLKSNVVQVASFCVGFLVGLRIS